MTIFRTKVVAYDSYRCWRDWQGIHFINEAGYSDCAHTISRRHVLAFMRELGIPRGRSFNRWLRDLDSHDWDDLHWQIHAEADDNFVWIGTDEIEKWGQGPA